MKKIFRLSALFCAMTLLVTSCTQEVLDEPQVKPAVDGSEIQFGARAGFENADESRTVYTNEFYDVITNGVTATFEKIDWVDYNAETQTGDVIDIYSPEANNGPVSSYWVNDSSQPGNNTDEGYLIKTQDSSLQWNGNGSHTFYGVYPSNAMFGAMTTPIVNTFADGVLTATISNEQHSQGAEEISINSSKNKRYEIKPDMRFAYMVAKTTVDAPTSSVSLSFVPCVTAIRVVLQYPKTTDSSKTQYPSWISFVELQGKGILGQFTADLKNWTNTTYPSSENLDDSDAIQSINMLIRDNAGQPIKMQPGDELAFTVFVRPGNDINVSDLTVKFSENGSIYKSKSLEESTAVIPAMKKSNLKGLKMPMILDNFEFGQYSKWMSQLRSEVQMNKLSLPGTGGTFSYNYKSSNPDWYKQQTLRFMDDPATKEVEPNQWDQGIRAFEIVSDRPSDASTTLGTQNVKCNKVSMGVTVLEVLQDLLAKTASVGNTVKDANGNDVVEPTECAVLILTYQPEGNSPNRNGASYASSLKAMYDGLTTTQKAQIIQYKPDLTLKDAKGKVMIFCRINQKDENDNGDTTEKTAFQLATKTLDGTKITLIDGCGTGKDRWGSRGYKVNGNVAYDAANTGDKNKSVDYYLTQQLSGTTWTWPAWSNVTVPNYSNSNQPMAFGFKTNYSDVTCWYQEWARVVPETIIDTSLGWYHVKNTGLGILDIYADYRWYESYTEKLNAAKGTFDMAISDKYPNYVFINSLCGYMVDKNIESSYTIFTGSNTGGIAGNIKALADKLNPDFGGYVREVIAAGQAGPTGIIMMDYVSANPNDDASYYLPSVIISNNIYTGNANTGGNTGSGDGEGGGQTGGGSGEGEGGNVGGGEGGGIDPFA